MNPEFVHLESTQHKYDGTMNDGFCECGKPVYDPIHIPDPYPVDYDPHARLVSGLDIVRRACNIPNDAQCEIMVFQKLPTGARAIGVFRRAASDSIEELHARGETPIILQDTGDTAWFQRFAISQQELERPCREAGYYSVAPGA